MAQSVDKASLMKMNTAISQILFEGNAVNTTRVKVDLLPEGARPSQSMGDIVFSDTVKADIMNGLVSFIQDNPKEQLDEKFIHRLCAQSFNDIPEDAMKARLEAMNAYLDFLYQSEFEGEDLDGNPMELATALRIDLMRLKKQTGRAYLEEENLEERAARDKKIYNVITKYINEMLFYVSDSDAQGAILHVIKSCDKGVHLNTDVDELKVLEDDEKEQVQAVMDKLYAFQSGDAAEGDILIMPGEESLAYSLTRDVVSRWMLF